MQRHELEDVAASLYDGGWRAEDRAEMVSEYGLTTEEASQICELLLTWDDVDHWAFEDGRIEVFKREHDYECKKFEVWDGDELVGTIYPESADASRQIQKDLSSGISPYGWDDGQGGTIGWRR